jgi:hypothetical protein
MLLFTNVDITLIVPDSHDCKYCTGKVGDTVDDVEGSYDGLVLCVDSDEAERQNP